ncbi:MAG: prolyl oligopeptidase family serine peptidase [Gemmataceae bacterium]|nr:prolyl oligopeptidase family serine peptidase [Planctomycetia bacterium]MBX3397994.1 prolyl oligopeptidase family serine peptidase [Gemmataceae bacterium]
MRSLALGLVFAVASISLSQTPSKRPLKHSDYDIWNSASQVELSPNGQWLVYNLMPPEGDGATIVRSLTGPAEYKFAMGRAGEGMTALAGGARFLPDGQRLALPLVPTKAEQDKAKAAKATVGPELAIVDLANGKIVERIGKLKSFAVVEKTNFLLMHREPKKSDTGATGAVVGGAAFTQPGATPAAQPATPGTGSPTGGVRRPGGIPGSGRPGGRPATAPPSESTASQTPTAPIGSDLVIRNLADGTETSFADVQGYEATRDGKLILIQKVSKTDADNGLFAIAPGSKSLTTIRSGTGRYARDTWDRKQERLAFFHEEPAPETKPNEPKPVVRPRVYLWDRNSKSPAAEILNGTIAGLPAGMMLAERGGLRFSDDGLKLALGTMKIPEPRTPAPPTAPADRVDLDLWHWKDELIQPMQKSPRGEAERNRTSSAVYFFDTKTFRQLGDENLSVSVPGFGDWTLASNDKPYRHLTGYGASLADYALLNIRTGETKPVYTAHEGIPLASPKGRYRLHFDGKDWQSLSVPDGKRVNLTAKLPVKFFDEEFDQPMKSSAYGIVAWANDEKHVLLADRYDIWKIALDGTAAENLTKIGREQKIRFNLISYPNLDEEPQYGLDLSKPYLLLATNLSTYDTGYFRLEPGSKPKLLVMGGRSYGRPVKARKADTLLFTVSSFNDVPDYHVADPSFREVRRVTDINPRKREFNWGKAELVNYKSADGVELSGVLIKPEDFDPQKKYPMIVYIYERLSDELHRFQLPSAGTSINPTYYASNGYLVFKPDIAYTVGSPGQSALKCVLPAIQAVVDKGYVNEAAIGIQGHSWGGYQIAYMVTQTNRFKAAASGAPVTNMVSAYGGIRWGTGLPRQFQYERTQSRIGQTLWDAPMKFIENSPIFMADRVKTPLMILHNDQDDAVPWYQGIEYYLALRRLGKECYLFNYNGEFHGLRKKSTQRDYTLRMQQFFDHHLKGAPMPEWMAKGIPFAEREQEKNQWKSLFKPEAK